MSILSIFIVICTYSAFIFAFSLFMMILTIRALDKSKKELVDIIQKTKLDMIHIDSEKKQIDEKYSDITAALNLMLRELRLPSTVFRTGVSRDTQPKVHKPNSDETLYEREIQEANETEIF